MPFAIVVILGVNEGLPSYKSFYRFSCFFLVAISYLFSNSFTLDAFSLSVRMSSLSTEVERE
jgi:hypothetical protein